MRWTGTRGGTGRRGTGSDRTRGPPAATTTSTWTRCFPSLSLLSSSKHIPPSLFPIIHLLHSFLSMPLPSSLFPSPSPPFLFIQSPSLLSLFVSHPNFHSSPLLYLPPLFLLPISLPSFIFLRPSFLLTLFLYLSSSLLLAPHVHLPPSPFLHPTFLLLLFIHTTLIHIPPSPLFLHPSSLYPSSSIIDYFTCR